MGELEKANFRFRIGETGGVVLLDEELDRIINDGAMHSAGALLVDASNPSCHNGPCTDSVNGSCINDNCVGSANEQCFNH